MVNPPHDGGYQQRVKRPKANSFRLEASAVRLFPTGRGAGLSAFQAHLGAFYAAGLFGLFTLGRAIFAHLFAELAQFRREGRFRFIRGRTGIAQVRTSNAGLQAGRRVFVFHAALGTVVADLCALLAGIHARYGFLLFFRRRGGSEAREQGEGQGQHGTYFDRFHGSNSVVNKR